MSQSQQEYLQSVLSQFQGAAGAQPQQPGSLRLQPSEVPKAPYPERNIYEGAQSLVGRDYLEHLPRYNDLYPSAETNPVESGIRTQTEDQQQKIMQRQVYPPILQLSQQAGPRGFTYAGRVGKPGESAQSLLARSPYEELETGGSYVTAPQDILALLGGASTSGSMAGIAFHGSPNSPPFSQFKKEFIGSGEGGSAYGHGLYFAEEPKTAATYRGQPTVTIKEDGKKMPLVDWATADERTPAERHAAGMVNTVGLARSIQFYKEFGALNQLSDTESSAVKLLHDWKEKGKIDSLNPGGHLYQVDVPDEHIAKMLDWDKPLSEQPKVKAIIDKQFASEEALLKSSGVPFKPVSEISGKWTGGQAYSVLADFFRNKPNPTAYKQGQSNKPYASDVLHNAGIPGIKYLDQFSRQKGEGTRNFVVFDPAILRDFKRLE